MNDILVYCTKCGQLLAIHLFSKDARNTKRHGTRSSCKKCHAAYASSYRRNNEDCYTRQKYLAREKRLALIRNEVALNPDLALGLFPTPGIMPTPLNKHQRLILEAIGRQPILSN